MYKCPACTASFFFESNLKKHAAAKHRLNNCEGECNQNPLEYPYSTSRVRRVPREAANMWISVSQILDAHNVPNDNRVVLCDTPYATGISSLAQSIDDGVLDAVRWTSSNNTR